MSAQRSLSVRSVRSTSSDGGITVLSPDGSSLCGGESVSTHPGNQCYHDNPITDRNTVIGVPRKKSCNSPLMSASLHNNSSNGTQHLPVVETRVQDVSAVGDIETQKVSEWRNCLEEETQGSNTDVSSSEEEDEEEEEEEGQEEEGGDEGEESVPHTAQEVLHAAGVDLDLTAVQPKGGAPLELVTQFLTCVMDEEFEAAKLLCEKVLEFEPSNSTAQEFLPVILERIKLDAELSSESSSESSEVSGSEEEEMEEEGRTAHSHTHKHCSLST